MRLSNLLLGFNQVPNWRTDMVISDEPCAKCGTRDYYHLYNGWHGPAGVKLSEEVCNDCLDKAQAALALFTEREFKYDEFMKLATLIRQAVPNLIRQVETAVE